MKTHLMSLAAAVVLLASCGSSRTTTMSSSTNNAAYGVPSSVGTNFASQFPGATNIHWSAYDATVVPVDWELNGWPALTGNDYMVTFDQYGNRYYAWYDASGNWIGSSYAVTNLGTLPAGISTMLAQNYSGYTIESAHREQWKGNAAYQIKLRNYDGKLKLLVDENGAILKQKNKVE
ncbi:PepSY-like domain-containing protein [Flaviaesturariibacter terrae]